MIPMLQHLPLPLLLHLLIRVTFVRIKWETTRKFPTCGRR